MPDISRYKSIALPIPVWNHLVKMAEANQRSPAQQVSFMIEEAKETPSDMQIRKLYAGLLKKSKK
tara:strand:+ start:273 stop:467 length:195 start_codon:yes stop_codon:yes gene_type:complete